MATFNPNLTIQTSGIPEEQKPAVQPVDAITSVPPAPVPNMPVLNEQPITPVTSAAPNNQSALQTQLTTLQQQLIPLLEQQKKQQEARVAATETTTPTEEPEAPIEEPTDSFGTILSQFGINEQQSLEDVIKSVSTAYGLEGINDEITKLDQEFIDKTGTISDNPWLSEGIRASKVAQERNKYEQKKDALINQLRLRGDVVSQAISVYFKEREFKKELLFRRLDERQKQIDTQRGAGISPTADITEYGLAVDQGYGGSFLDYQREVANLKSKAIGAGGGLVEAPIKPIKLSSSQQEDIATGQTLTSLANSALSLARQTDFAGTGGLGLGSLKAFFAQAGVGSPEGQKLRNLVGNITGTLAKLRGGTSFTESEKDLLETYTPTINDSALVMESKLISLIDFISEKRNAILDVVGGVTNTAETRMYQGALYQKVSGGWQKVQ